MRDFEQVSWKPDANGNSLVELDKIRSAAAYASDALGYYIAEEFAMRPLWGKRREWVG